MYGIFTPSIDLELSDKQTLKAHLCQVCNTLDANYSIVYRLLTNYDAAFLSLLTSAQCESSDEPEICSLFHRKRGTTSISSQFASAVVIKVSEMVLHDKIAEKKSILSKLLLKVVSKDLKKANVKLADLGSSPDIFTRAIDKQHSMEKKTCDFMDYASVTETLVADVYEHTAHLSGKPENAKHLHTVGKHIGRLMYFWDSYIDVFSDCKYGRFNSLLTGCQDLISTNSIVKCNVKFKSIIENISRDSLSAIKEEIPRINLVNSTELISRLLTDNVEQKLDAILAYQNEQTRKVTKYAALFDQLKYAPISTATGLFAGIFPVIAALMSTATGQNTCIQDRCCGC